MRDGVITASSEREKCIRANIEECYEECNTMFTVLAHNHTRCQDVCMREASRRDDDALAYDWGAG